MMECGVSAPCRKSGVLFRVMASFVAALVCAGIFALAIVPNAYAATETVTGSGTSVGTILTSIDGKVQYKILTEAGLFKNGTVQVSEVSKELSGAFAIPDTVTRLSYTYQVTSLDAAAFVNASALTSIDIPATVACSSLYLYGCANLQSITVDEGNTLLTAENNILYNKDKTTLIACSPNFSADAGKFTVPATVKIIGDSAFRNNTELSDVQFACDLEGVSDRESAIGSYAFSGCTALKSVVFPQKVAGIGSYAFSGCTKLSTVTFPEGGELYVSNGGPIAAIDDYAFSGCTSLESITIPAVTSTVRSPDYYHTFEEYNPTSNFPKTSSTSVTSGYRNVTASFFGGDPTPRIAIAEHAFKDCASLKSVVLKAGGANWGMFSYFNGQGPKQPGQSSQQSAAFEGCSSLQSIVYEAEQPYWADPNRSLFGGSFVDYWERSGITAPSLYYAVDYYAASNVAKADDSAASNRLARVEYRRGTSTAAIAKSDAGALKDSAYADREAYAQKDADGNIPNAKQAAVDAGLDTADSGKAWVWKLSDTQSRREDLTDSCYAYLAEANNIFAGRVDADQITIMYKLCDQNLSRGSVQDTAFDPARWYSTLASGTQTTQYRFTDGTAALALNDGETAWFTLSSSTEESFYGKIKVRTADGTELDPADYTTTFQRYDATTGSYVETELGQADGPLLMTVTPSEGSGYTGTLQEWVLVEGHVGSVLEQFTDSVESTWSAACYYKKNNLWNISFDSPYAVAISSADPSSALVAAGYAGLVKAPINVTDVDKDSYGFGLSASYSVNGTISVNGLMSFSAESFDAPAAFAVATYQAFDAKRDGLGASLSQYPWGDTAVLVAPGSVSDVAASAAAYAYAKKAPVFYAEDDSSVSDDTLECLKDFSKVVVIGDATQFSDEALSAVASSLGVDIPVTLISGDTGSASALGLAVADTLASEEPATATSSIVTVSDGTDVADAISALNLSGHESGLTLVSSCTADSKRISAYLYDRRDSVNTVRLYGRDASNISSDSFDFLGSLQDLWDVSGYVQPVVGADDTLVLDGVLFNVGADNTLEFTGTRLWGTAELDAGTYSYNGVDYTLAKGTANPVDPDPNPTPDPDPTPDTGPNSKPNGILTIGDSSQGSISVGTNGTGSNPSTGMIEVSLPGADENVQTGDSGEGEAPVYADENQSSDDQGEDGDPAAGSQTSASPVAAVALIVVALGALGAALWFAMRKRNPVAVLSE